MLLVHCPGREFRPQSGSRKFLEANLTLSPTLPELSERARADLRIGLLIVLRNDTLRILVAAVETLSDKRLVAMRQNGTDLNVTITARRATTLKARVYDNDIARIALPESADLAWIVGVANPALDLPVPLKGPFKSLREGSSDLNRIAVNLVKSAQLLPAALIASISETVCRTSCKQLTSLNLSKPKSSVQESPVLYPVASAHMPLAVAKNSRVHVYRAKDAHSEHYAIEIGKPDRSLPILVRLHSACFSGDVLGSLKCDCGPQLRTALDLIGEQKGVLLYLNQEGRGIGLANKMRAYSLQDQGFDTVEANHRLGFESDERDFRLGANILKAMGIGAVRLLTNNPAKIKILADNGIKVTEQIPLKIKPTQYNQSYLETKAIKMGHKI